jgi:hypothetical protein
VGGGKRLTYRIETWLADARCYRHSLQTSCNKL